MVTIWNIKINTLSEDDLLQVELRGLSTDTKPTSLIGGIIDNGSVFIEIDTQDVYIYDGENKEWVIPTQDDSQDEEPQDENQGDNKNKIDEDLEKEIKIEENENLER